MRLKKIVIGTFALMSITSFGYEPVSYTFDDGVYKKEITVKKAPERAVTLAQFMTETLLALGLQDKMIGTALLNEEILPEYKTVYEKIPELEMGEGHSISKESFIATGADFVTGWEQSITEEATGSLEELEERGITPFISRGLAPDATIESVYSDFILLGKIFQVPEKAQEIVNKMKKEVELTYEKTKDMKDRPKVLIYDSGEGEAFVGGSGLPNDLIRLAGGENIYKDLGQDYATVSFEDIVEKNPEIIVVTEYYSGITAEEKIKFLKNHPGLKNIDAIKNNRIYKIGLIDLAPGIRNSKTVGKLYQMFYGNEK
ncbi:ABC transporter substrate-binding protein [Fusobacterium sp.]|uniref:ABC transporter substrate-binding protein n=1 Tax=Fusobacterium sp. TaxID=68766 RepID=UPI00262399D0|nr:ABC transporter substrate-binding protein [Fusobacterium sp.]